jgi:predicted CopG family antitoxin
MVQEEHVTHRVMAATQNSDDVGRTSIQVSERLADELHSRKGRGDSYEDVIWELIERADSDVGDARARDSIGDSTVTAPREEHADAEPEDDVVDRVVEEAAENWDDRNSRLQARKAAARAVLNELRTVGPMSKSEIVEDIQGEYPVEGQSENTWWRKNIAEDGPLNRVAEYDAGTQKWRWVGLGGGDEEE